MVFAAPRSVFFVIPQSLMLILKQTSIELIDGVGLGVGFGEKVSHVYNSS